jgi:predicted nucleic acid-binding protein
MKVASVIGITDEIVDETIAIRRAYKIKLPDAIIAATAINKKLILVTRNVTDFKIIQELVLVNPWDK